MLASKALWNLEVYVLIKKFNKGRITCLLRLNKKHPGLLNICLPHLYSKNEVGKNTNMLLVLLKAVATQQQEIYSFIFSNEC